jgi:hypothetical protein
VSLHEVAERKDEDNKFELALDSPRKAAGGSALMAVIFLLERVYGL